MSHRMPADLIRILSISSVAAMLLAAGSTRAQVLFQPLSGPNSRSKSLAASKIPQGVAVADFNHDGFLDMVVANQGANTISLYLSTGPGTFAAPVTYPTCGGPAAVLATDLNNSGLQDIVVACKYSSADAIEVFLNQGNGTFNSTVDGVKTIVLGAGKNPTALASGDFNDDGHPDLAVADMGDGTITLFLSNASSNFTSYTIKTVAASGAPAGIATGKFDISGNIDLAVTDSAGDKVDILAGDGKGNFIPGPSISVGGKPTGIVSGDWNHDGHIDLAVLNSQSGTLSILLGMGNDAFQSSASIDIGGNHPTYGDSIRALDLNNDGNLDLLAGNVAQGNIAILLSNGDGTFQPPQYFPIPHAGPAYLAAGDFTRTGRPDLAVSEQNSAAVAALINNTLPVPPRGGRNFDAPYNVSTGYGNMADSITTADFNGDGEADVAISYLEDNAVRVMIGYGNGYFKPAVMYPVGKQPYDVVSGDLNNDGYPDLVTANTTDGTVSVLLNNGGGTGTFAAAQTYPVGKLPFQVAIGDLNGDGIPDLAVTNYGDNTVSVLYGQINGGSLTYIAGPVLTTGTNPYGVAIADFRHTGINDIAVTCFHTAQLYYFQNNGGGSFQSPGIYSTDSNPATILVGDFNRDGNLDIVTGNTIANDVSFFAGTGSGTFLPVVNSFALNFPVSIAVGDINGDGIPDLVGVAPNFNQATVLLGNGDGTFVPRMDYSTGPQPWAIALADTNHDGKLDIVTANTYNRVNLTIPSYQNRYMQQFPPTTAGNPSFTRAFNASGAKIGFSISPSGKIPFQSPVTLTSMITPTVGKTPPSGSVTFEDSNGAVLGNGPVSLDGSGSATLTLANLGSGYHPITVLYSGDSLYQPITAALPNYSANISGVPTTLTLQPTTVTVGATYNDTVTVTTNLTKSVGTVSLYAIHPDGSVSTVGGPQILVTNGNGTATATGTLMESLPAGNYFIYAIFTPVTGEGGSSNNMPVTFVP